MGSDDLDRFLWKLNGYENIIQFTLESEKTNIDISRYANKTGKGFLQQKFTQKKHTHENISIGHPTIPTLKNVETLKMIWVN